MSKVYLPRATIEAYRAAGVPENLLSLATPHDEMVLFTCRHSPRGVAAENTFCPYDCEESQENKRRLASYKAE